MCLLVLVLLSLAACGPHAGGATATDAGADRRDSGGSGAGTGEVDTHSGGGADSGAGADSGEPGVDHDGDGYSVAEGDCDDTDAAATPVSWYPHTGGALDLTAVLGAGAPSSPVSHTISEDGELRFCDGTWYVHLRVGADQVVIAGHGGAEGTTLSGASSDRVITSDRSDGALTIRGLTVVDGHASPGGGGGVYGPGGSLQITDSVFQGNGTVGSGGAVLLAQGELAVSGSRFEGNWADEDGGALYQDRNAHTQVTGSAFRDNTAGDDGGAVAVASGFITVEGSSFESNATNGSAASTGGAIWMGDGVTRIFGSDLSGNSAPSGGGAIALSRASIELEDGWLEGNEAGAGGAVQVRFEGAIVRRTTFIDNLADRGGALHGEEVDMLVSGSTFLRNLSMSDPGGAIRLQAGALRAEDCDFGTDADDNSPDDVYFDGESRVYGAGASFEL